VKPERGMQMMYISQMREEGKVLSRGCRYAQHRRCSGKANSGGARVDCVCWCHEE
jgi:hypothetical protein